MAHSKVALLAALFLSSNLAHAEFFDGFDNGNGVGQGNGSGQANTYGSGQGYGDSNGDVNGWGRGRGNADGNVDFSINFKGKGRTDMNSDLYGRGRGDASGNLYGNGYGYGDGYNNLYGYSNSYTNGGNPWGGYYGGGYPGYGMMPMPYMQAPGYSSMPNYGAYAPAPTYGGMSGYNYNSGYMPAPAPAPAAPNYAYGNPPTPNFEQIQKQMDAQRAQAEAYLKSLDEQRKALAEQQKKAMEAAKEGGAEVLTLCDTNGGCFPEEILEITKIVKEKLGDIKIGIHAHNDMGFGVANSAAAVEAGALQVQGTFLGYGERCGNANLSTIIANLQLKKDY